MEKENMECMGYLCFIEEKSKKRIGVWDIPIVNEFIDVVPDETLGLSSHREINFEIEHVPSTQSISKLLFRTASVELKKIKIPFENLWIKCIYGLVSHLREHQFYLGQRNMKLWG